MGKNLVKMTGFRFAEETLIPKLDIIAQREKRNRNQQVEYALSLFVAQYEQEHGEIPVDSV